MCVCVCAHAHCDCILGDREESTGAIIEENRWKGKKLNVDKTILWIK